MFYYDETCIVHKFEEIKTKDTAIYKLTLNICKIRKGNLAKNIEFRLLWINELVAAEARYHITCKMKFEKPFSVSTPGRPVERDKQENFEKACIALENDMELFIVSKFSKFMLEFEKESETEVYSVRMSNSKLKDRYSDTLTLFTGKAEATSNYWTK